MRDEGGGYVGRTARKGRMNVQVGEIVGKEQGRMKDRWSLAAVE